MVRPPISNAMVILYILTLSGMSSQGQGDGQPSDGASIDSQASQANHIGGRVMIIDTIQQLRAFYRLPATVAVFDLTSRCKNRQLLESIEETELGKDEFKEIVFGYVDCWRLESLCMEAGIQLLPALVVRVNNLESEESLPIDGNPEVVAQKLENSLRMLMTSRNSISKDNRIGEGLERIALSKQGKLSSSGMLLLCLVSTAILITLTILACFSESPDSRSKDFVNTLQIELQADYLYNQSMDTAQGLLPQNA